MLEYFQDLLFNPASGTGFLINKIKNNQTKRREIDCISKSTKKFKTNSTEKVPTILDITDSEETNIAFLKNSNAKCPVQKELIKEKLKHTIECRRLLVSSVSVNLKHYFPFFFHSPDLVCKLLTYNIQE